MTDLLSHFFWAESGGRIHSCQVKFELEAVHRPFFKPGFPTPLREAMLPWIDDWWPIRSYPTGRHKDDRNIEVIYQIDPNCSKKMDERCRMLQIPCTDVWVFDCFSMSVMFRRILQYLLQAQFCPQPYFRRAKKATLGFLDAIAVNAKLQQHFPHLTVVKAWNGWKIWKKGRVVFFDGT